MEKKRKQEEKGDYSLPHEFFKTISYLPVESLKTKDNKVFVCTREDKLMEVWKGLADHQFSSVPVLQKTKNKYYGVLDNHEIMSFVLSYYGDQDLKSIENFWSIVEKSEKLKNVTVDHVMKYPRALSNVFHPVSVGYSLHFAIELLAREEHLERIPIITKERNLYGMLTISRVVQFLSENKHLLGHRLLKPINLLGCANTGVFSIKESDKALSAFVLMKDKNINCIAVEDDKGALTGVISQTDIKVISQDGSLFYKLHQTAKAFVEQIQTHNRVISVLPTDNIEKVIDTLHTSKLHRIFVINNEKDKSAVGVISLKDVVRDILCH